MKNYLKSLFPALLTALLVSSCAGCSKRETHSGESTDSVKAEPVLVVESFHWEDSLSMGHHMARVCMDVAYPMDGETRLVDSARVWIAEVLGYDRILLGHNAVRLDDGCSLLAAAGDRTLNGARTEMEEFGEDDDWGLTYESVATIVPLYVGDSIVTYNSEVYIYTGGAHGSTSRMPQSFVVSTGKRLGLAEMFPPEATARLTDLVRDGLRKQYFGATGTAGEQMSLEDALLISPDALSLPTCPPLCVDSGMVFIYQQYEIAPYAAGMPTCVLPYKALRPLMRPEFIGLLPEWH